MFLWFKLFMDMYIPNNGTEHTILCFVWQHLILIIIFSKLGNVVTNDFKFRIKFIVVWHSLFVAFLNIKSSLHFTKLFT